MKKTINPTAALRTLKKELAQERATLTTVRAELKEARDQLAGFTRSQTAHETELNDMQSRLAIARSVLQPLAEKTKNWSWPAPEIQVWRPLTFGDIKRAADAAVNFK